MASEGLLKKLANESPQELQRRSRESLNWFKGRVRGIRMNADQFYKQSVQERTRRYMRGRMYTFFYDAKWADKLPYWDRFPLVVVFDTQPDRMLGINLHYIAPRYRVILLEEMFKYTNNDMFDETTRFRLQYPILKSVSKFRWCKPAMKSYLYGNVMGNALEINPAYWDVISMLPLAQFQKAGVREVYRDTFRKTI